MRQERCETGLIEDDGIVTLRLAIVTSSLGCCG